MYEFTNIPPLYSQYLLFIFSYKHATVMLQLEFVFISFSNCVEIQIEHLLTKLDMTRSLN